MLPLFFAEKYFGVSQDYYNQLKKECKLCEHNGYIMVDTVAYRDCDCTKTFLANKEYIKSGVPVVNFTKGNLKFSEIFETSCQERFKELIKFVRKLTEPTTIFIHSKERKDHSTSLLASLVTINMIDAGFDAGMVKTHELVETFFNFERDESGWDKLCEMKVLVIDGFGQENNKQLADEESFITTRFTNFLNLRESMNTITIFAGDIVLDDLKGKYCDSIVNYFVCDCLKFEAVVNHKKESAYDRLTKTNPEAANIFSKQKVKPSEGENVKPKQTKPNRGRTL